MPSAERRPADLVSSVYEQVKSGILSGSFEPGAPLVELQLAELCGVSRTPIRESLTRLEQDGLIVRGERGFVVKTRSPEEILDIYEVRTVNEALTCRLAAERYTRIDGIRITRALETWEAEGNSDEPERRAAVNDEFHRCIWQASHSEPLMDLLGRISLHLLRYPETTLMAPGRYDSALKEHSAMVEAVLCRDGAAAAEIATQHFTSALNIRLDLFKSGGL